jgi:signal transduction histidine kinase
MAPRPPPRVAPEEGRELVGPRAVLRALTPDEDSTPGVTAAAVRAIAALRVVLFAWAVTAVAVSHDALTRPWVAWSLLAVAGVVTGACATALVRPQLRRGGWLAVELAAGWALAAGTGVVYGHDGGGPSSVRTLGGVWPLAGVLTAGVAYGPWAGGVTGACFGAARLVGALMATDGSLDAAQVWTVASSTLLSVVAGTLIAAGIRWVGRLETETATSAAHERVARELHDGVLQTLAVIESRSSDPEAVRLARAESRRLRTWLFGAPAGATQLDVALLEALGGVEDRFGVRCELALVEHVALPAEVCERLAGAVGEAAANAAKHGGTGCTVLVVPDDDGVSVSVHDDGPGFDVGAVRAGVGIARSIRGRIEEAGGTVQIESEPGRGCEVRLWVPMRPVVPAGDPTP